MPPLMDALCSCHLWVLACVSLLILYSSSHPNSAIYLLSCFPRLEVPTFCLQGPLCWSFSKYISCCTEGTLSLNPLVGEGTQAWFCLWLCTQHPAQDQTQGQWVTGVLVNSMSPHTLFLPRKEDSSLPNPLSSSGQLGHNPQVRQQEPE
jgi:hypothetical protein